jgi:hypothetical protein
MEKYSPLFNHAHVTHSHVCAFYCLTVECDVNMHHSGGQNE